MHDSNVGTGSYIALALPIALSQRMTNDNYN